MRSVAVTLAALLAAALAASAQAPAGGPFPVNLPTVPGAYDPANPRLATPGGGGVPALPVAGGPVVGGPAPALPAAPGAVVSNPQLVAHLREWEKAMRGTVNFRSDFELTKKDATFGKERAFAGSVLCMKPNLARLRLDEKANKANFEAYICNGRSVFHYDGSSTTLTEHRLDPAAMAGGDNLMLDFLSGMKAEDAQSRFDLSLFKEDQFYVYLDIKPKLPKDRQEFEQVRFAIYGPNTKQLAYMPAQVWLLKPNGDTEFWKFSNPQTNLPGVDAKLFAGEAPPKGWTVRQAPPMGGPAPAGGAMTPPPGPRVARPAGP